jgi:hypothetical protein
VAIRANFDLQILTDGRTRLELVPAGARDRDLFVFGMDAGFHKNLLTSVTAESKCFQRKGSIATPKTPNVLARSQEINAKNRAAHHMRTAPYRQALFIAHICPQ